MASHGIGKFLPSFKLKLGTKAVISAVLLIAVNTALVVGAAYWSWTQGFDERALRDIDVNLRTLTLSFGEQYKDAKITLKDGVVSRVELAQMPEFKDHAIVDRAVSYVGGNATLFVYDDATNQFVRRSTNVKKENGDRAVGTQLAADHPGQALLRRGEAYKGPAILFGKSFMTAYFPVASPAGKVIGVLYVGIPMAQFEAMLAHAIQTMVIAAALAALVVLALTMLIVRRVTKPLTSVTGPRSLRSLMARTTSQSTATTAPTRSAKSRARSRSSRAMRRNASGCVSSRRLQPRQPPNSARRSSRASSTISGRVSAVSLIACRTRPPISSAWRGS
jgi:methyl-accepting chemotaxis protein